MQALQKPYSNQLDRYLGFYYEVFASIFIMKSLQVNDKNE